VPLAVVALVITGRGTVPMVNVNVAFPVPLPLVALRVTVEVLAEVGVPEMSPVVLLTESPAGNPEAP
jgi:hypothetical protein